MTRYDFIQMQDELLQHIQSKLNTNLLEHNPDTVKKLIIQIEALYVFAIFKSLLYSQVNDPFIKGLLFKYQVPCNSEAIFAFKPTWWEKPQLQGLPQFNMKGIKVELDSNSIALTNKRFIKIPMILFELTKQTLGKHKLFRFPFDLQILTVQNHVSSDFKRIPLNKLQEIVNEFPLDHSKFVYA